MSDDGYHRIPKLDAYLPPELEELLARRLVHRALRQIVFPITLVAAVLAFIGFDQVLDLHRVVDEQKQALLNEQKKLNDEQIRLRAEQETLRVAARAARDNATSLGVRFTEQVGEMNAQRISLEQSASQFRNGFIQTLQRTANLAGTVASRLQASQQLDSSLAAWMASIGNLRAVQDSIHRFSGSLSSLSHQLSEGSIQTVGAGKANAIIGTPLVLRFDGVTGTSLRRVRISTAENPRLWGPDDVRDSDSFSVTVGGTAYEITVVNVIDIPTRTDAASIRVRVKPASVNGLAGPAN